jgi:glucose-1-phosphate cytidylyltransferase
VIVAILAGGLGTRLAEETDIKPKPMVEIGGRPILWHIMAHYARHGFDEFVVALGYKGDVIKKYFVDYSTLRTNMTIHLAAGKVQAHDQDCENWTVHLIDTGMATQTGGRVKRLQPWIGTETFMITYGDGVSDIDLRRLLAYHESHGKLATVTAVHPPARFGSLRFDGKRVSVFAEKSQVDEGWINGGFLVMGPRVFDYLEGDASSLEADALERLAEDGQLMAYKHQGFWQSVDTLRDVRTLQALWESGDAPWV